MENQIINENRTYWTMRAASYSDVNKEELADSHRHDWLGTLEDSIRKHYPNKDKSELKILDIGTGPGFFAIILTEAGYNVTAIDLTPDMLKEAKKNAGDLASKIDFREMNAQELKFEDESFDIIINRNLTWNLPNPETAYKQWTRVLKKDGLMLIFDANWYLYLFDNNAMEAYEYDRQNSKDLGLGDQNVSEEVSFDIMEDIARRIPLSSIKRPAWDKKVLENLGVKVTLFEDIWKQVWDKTEKANFASTPMFLIHGIKL